MSTCSSSLVLIQFTKSGAGNRPTFLRAKNSVHQLIIPIQRCSVGYKAKGCLNRGFTQVLLLLGILIFSSKYCASCGANDQGFGGLLLLLSLCALLETHAVFPLLFIGALLFECLHLYLGYQAVPFFHTWFMLGLCIVSMIEALGMYKIQAVLRGLS